MVNKNKKNSGNSLVFGRWPQAIIVNGFEFPRQYHQRHNDLSNTQTWVFNPYENLINLKQLQWKKDPIFQIGPECLVGEDTKISEKTTIKNSVIGSHCTIEEKVKLTNCIIMDKVVVRSGSNLTGSLICDDVIVEQRADVKDSIVGQRQVVPAEGDNYLTTLELLWRTKKVQTKKFSNVKKSRLLTLDLYQANQT